jgi:hypothetical protein
MGSKQRAGEQDRWQESVRHESPFEYVRDGNTGTRYSRVAHASCRIAPFRRDGVSEVCQCGGILLAFAASQKCRSDESPGLCCLALRQVRP